MQIPSEGEYEIDQGSTHTVLTDKDSVTAMLQALGVEDNEEDLFLESFWALFYDGKICKEKYDLLKKYLGKKQFIDKSPSFLSSAREKLLGKGVLHTEIEEITLNIQFTIEEVLERFQIFDYVDDPSSIEDKYLSIAKFRKGEIIASNDGREVFLFRDGTFYRVDEVLYDMIGTQRIFVFNQGGSVIVYDHKTKQLHEVEGKWVNWMDKGNIHGIVTLSGDKEILTLIWDDIFHKVLISRTEIEEEPDFYTFVDVDMIGEYRQIPVITRAGFQVHLGTNHNNDMVIRQHMVGTLIALKESKKGFKGKKIFSDKALIQDVVATESDTYIVVERRFFKDDGNVGEAPTKDDGTLQEDQGNYGDDFTQVIHSVYSLSKEDYLPAIPPDAQYRTIATHDDLIILSVDETGEYLYSCKNDIGVGGIRIFDIWEYNIDGQNHVTIRYCTSEGKECNFDTLN